MNLRQAVLVLAKAYDSLAHMHIHAVGLTGTPAENLAFAKAVNEAKLAVEQAEQLGLRMLIEGE
jgi:hypothetical protein